MTSSDVTVLTHTDGFLLLGDPGTVDTLLAENKVSGMAPSPTLVGAIGSLLQASAVIAENSGRWVKLDEASAALLKQFGPSMSSTTGLMTGVVRNGAGAIKGHLQFVAAPAMLNPATLGAVGVMLTQMAQQRQLDEMKGYLQQISDDAQKLKDDQLHRAMADLGGIALTIEEVQTILDATGRVDPMLWTKLHGASQTLATTQAYALKKLEAAANGLAAAAQSSELGDDEKAMRETRDSSTAWLKVLGHSIMLADSLAQLEIERKRDDGVEQLEDYIRGLEAARAKRTERIAGTVEHILSAANDLAQAAQARRLTHPRRVASITASNNEIHARLAEFSRVAGVQNERFAEIDNPRFRQFAVSRLKDVASEAAQLPGRVGNAKDAFLLDQADRIRAKRQETESTAELPGASAQEGDEA